ncbi:hypothetical protein AKJ37_06595 [candidate division MSBL1 archaeon SCGC-AAA259I09]|uniref:Phosphoglycolate phosphatase n=1 Tax=candidate division MSBL1 archaeon SCGC-AAA259I09 TaxID=1698267 RepID=A0A133UNG4_9EURY|nr:hypothetical protein AKJ37_06595 [candidate division MSBL1 archaeon SCGC-AAA259I09]
MTKLCVHRGEEPIHAIVFDMDNTLFDLVKAKLNACRKVTGHVGINDGEELFEYFLRDEVGFEDVKNIADYLRDRGFFEETVYRDCREIYENEKLENLQVYDGVRETLSYLNSQGLRLGLVSDANRKNVQARLERTKLGKYFDTTVSRERTGKTKPEPEPVKSALNDLGVDPENAMMVGDSLRRDIAPGKGLGMVTAHAEYGDRNLESEEGPESDFGLQNPRDLVDLLKAS